MTSELAAAIKDFGFPIVAAMGLGYFVYYVWQWVTLQVKPVLSDASATLIKLVDRIRMLDNDMIRLNTKLSMILEYYQKKGMEPDKDLEKVITKYQSQSNTRKQDKK